MPKADIFLNIYLDDEDFTTNVKSYILAQTFMNIFSKKFKETRNMASKAKLNLAINLEQNHIKLNAYGFNDTIMLLIDTTLNYMFTLKIDDKQLFKNVFDQMMRQLINFETNKPNALAKYFFGKLSKSCMNFSIED